MVQLLLCAGPRALWWDPEASKALCPRGAMAWKLGTEIKTNKCTAGYLVGQVGHWLVGPVSSQAWEEQAGETSERAQRSGGSHPITPSLRIRHQGKLRQRATGHHEDRGTLLWRQTIFVCSHPPCLRGIRVPASPGPESSEGSPRWPTHRPSGQGQIPRLPGLLGSGPQALPRPHALLFGLPGPVGPQPAWLCQAAHCRSPS